MEFDCANNLRPWLYQRRFPIWFSFERATGWIAFPVVVAGLFAAEVCVFYGTLALLWLAIIGVE